MDTYALEHKAFAPLFEETERSPELKSVTTITLIVEMGEAQPAQLKLDGNEVQTNPQLAQQFEETVQFLEMKHEMMGT